MSAKVFVMTVLATLVMGLTGACSGTDATPTLLPTATPAASSGSQATATPIPTATPTLAVLTTNETPVTISGVKSPVEIVRLLRPSVVHIQTEAVRLDQFNRPSPVQGVGTGQIIDGKGHILTNNHVVDGARRILVTLSDGRAFEAEFIGGDPFTDLAVVRIDGEGLVPIAMGESSTLEVGESVIVMGHALNLPGGPTITGGLVSALERSIDISPMVTMEHLIQTDAAINPGNSGGPLVNLKGELVGIATIKVQAGEGIGFAIAIDPAKPLIAELIAQGRIDRGFLGVSVLNITEALALNVGLAVSKGVGITSVVPDSPAEEAGLREADIIVRVGAKEVDNISDLNNIMIQYRKGTSVDIDYYRDDRRRTVSVTLGERPSS